MFKGVEQYMTLAKTAHQLDMPKKTLEKLVEWGDVPAFVWKDEKGKLQYRFDPEDIRKLMEKPKRQIMANVDVKNYKAGRLGYALLV